MTTVINILNVGRGSCAVIEHPSGRRSMIDINIAAKLPPGEVVELRRKAMLLEARRSEARLTHPVRWFWDRFGSDAELFRFILSHPDTDHLLGIGHLIQGDVPTAHIWDLPHSKTCDSFLSDLHHRHWEAYTSWRAASSSDPQSIQAFQGANCQMYGFAPGHDQLEILWPTPTAFTALNASENWNNMSTVVRAWYGGRSVLFPGDIERSGWTQLAALEDAGVINMSSDVLVASHHGRLSGYPADGVLRRINPGVVIISTDKLASEHSAVHLYAKVAQVYSTRWHRDIEIHMADTGQLDVSTESELLHTIRAPGFGHGFLYGS